MFLCTTSTCRSEMLNVEPAVEKLQVVFNAYDDRSRRNQVWNCILLTLLKWCKWTANRPTSAIKYSFGFVCVCVCVCFHLVLQLPHWTVAMAEAKGVLATPGLLHKNAPCLACSYPKWQINGCKLWCLLAILLTLIPCTQGIGLRYLDVFGGMHRIPVEVSTVAPAGTGAPHLDVEVQLPEHRIQVRGWEIAGKALNILVVQKDRKHS